ncbi:MAG TPA: cytochrome c oxidase subunit II [Acidimicrobiales bacterium]
MSRRAVLAAGLLLLAGCASAPSALDPQSPQARDIGGLWWLMFVLAVVVWLVVTSLIVFAVVRRRRGDSSGRHDQPFILIGGSITVMILAVVAVYTVRTTTALASRPAALTIHVAGEDWWWRVTYPSLGISTANEIHVPIDQTVNVTLTSDNVIHSFWVPQLAGKVDVIPGQTNHLSFLPERAGTYRGQCAEFCGIQHARMAFTVVVDTDATFRQWTAAQQATPAAPTESLAQAGQAAFENGPCAGCHTVAGTSATGTLGPNLTHVGSRATLAADTLPNTPAGMTRWLEHTQQVKPGALMPQLDLSTDEVRALVAYLEGLR